MNLELRALKLTNGTEKRGEAMKKIKTAIMTLVLASGSIFAPGALGVVSQLPFSTTFEANTLGSSLGSPWVASIPVVVTNTPASPASASTNVAYSADEVNLPINNLDYDYSNVWWHSYAKVRAHTNDLDAAEIDGAAVGFYLKDNGDLKAFSNNTWVTVATGVPTNGWLGFSVELDYVSKLWNLYKSTNPFEHGDSLEIVNKTGPLDFNAAYTGVNGLTNIQITGETYLDNVTVAKGFQEIPEVATPDRKVVSGDSVELMLGSSLSGVLLNYFSEADRKLDGPFGVALGSVMKSGEGITESISVYLPTNGGWQVYNYTGTGWSKQSGTVAVSDLVLTPTMGISFKLSDNAPRTAAFVAGYDGAPIDASGTATIYGRTINPTGWNLLALPLSESDRTINNGDASSLLGFVAGNGDRMYFKDINGRSVVLTYSTGTGWVQFGYRPVTVTMAVGTGFWYLRHVGADATYAP